MLFIYLFKLFTTAYKCLVLTNPDHVLSRLLPDKTDQHYYLRARHHDRQLVHKSNRLFGNNFRIRISYTTVTDLCYKV